MILKGDAISKEILSGGLRIEIGNLVNFHASSWTIDEKVQKSYASGRWRVIQRKANSWEICIFCAMQ